MEEGWKLFEEPAMSGDTSELLGKAETQILKADTKEKVIGIINTYETILKIDPMNREALLGAAMYCFLIAYGYSVKQEEKKKYFLDEKKYSEQLMYTNPDFKTLVDNGGKVWDGSISLTINEMGAMFWWYLGIAGYWQECQNNFKKLLTARLPYNGRKILAKMMEIDPKWWYGTPYYIWANQYAVLPGFLGGDIKKADEYYKKAIDLGPYMFNFRRTRALLLHTKTKNKEAFKKDLNWVLSEDPHRGGPSFPFNIFLQRNAKEMLDNIDNYF